MKTALTGNHAATFIHHSAVHSLRETLLRANCPDVTLCEPDAAKQRSWQVTNLLN